MPDQLPPPPNRDGVPRVGQAINGSIPGPTIVADWGDTVRVHMTNGLTRSSNGTSIHFHGIRQNFTNQMDGVSSITQCPTPPGGTYTYEWKALQFGTTWYHSHFALQAWEGVFGGIVINGPATADYDVDLGHVFLNDWDHETADALYASAQSAGPPTLDTGLVNGTNVWGDDGSTGQTGKRFAVSFEAGTRYRLRLVNGAIDTSFKFMIDGHALTVMANDLVPIVPYQTEVLTINIGQRYDVVVTADQAAVAQDFWLRAIPQIACSDNANPDDIKGIVYYGAAPGTPTTAAYNYTDSCDDEAASNLVPALSKAVAAPTWSTNDAVAVGYNAANEFRWTLNSTTFVSNWSDPTLLEMTSADSGFQPSEAVIQLPLTADDWVYFVVETSIPVGHPIHLHGFDFYVLAQGTGTYDGSTTALQLANPPRRDTAFLPPNGYLVMAFQTDNPGAWLCHCHIGWHTSEGFAMQFVVREAEIGPLLDQTVLKETCSAWTAYAAALDVEQDDSGV